LRRAVIGTDGEVHSLEVLSGNPILAQAALAAVRQWRYRPTLLSGQPVEVETQITVNFVLE
jgi:protein TonB